MPDRIERTLRAVSLGLAVILAVQLGLMITRRNPLRGLERPRIPQWTADSVPAITNTGPSTVAPPNASVEGKSGMPTPPAGTISATVSSAPGVTNFPAVLPGSTNIPLLAVSTNLAAPGIPSGTNTTPPTNRPIASGPSAPRPVFPSAPGSKPMRPPQPLPAASQTRIDRITSSEMLAPVFRPPPMALLGIAGHHAFIRTPSGQPALLKEGATSDGIKLLRLGTNRVLIEQAGEKKELIIFNGLGSASLLTH